MGHDAASTQVLLDCIRNDSSPPVYVQAEQFVAMFVQTWHSGAQTTADTNGTEEVDDTDGAEGIYTNTVA